MKKAKVTLATELSHMHNQEPGSCPVIRVLTDLPKGGNNCFYISPIDKNKVPLDYTLLKEGDEIEFDRQSGLQKAVRWNGREFRQRGYSYDFYAPLH